MNRYRSESRRRPVAHAPAATRAGVAGVSGTPSLVGWLAPSAGGGVSVSAAASSVVVSVFSDADETPDVRALNTASRAFASAANTSTACRKNSVAPSGGATARAARSLFFARSRARACAWLGGASSSPSSSSSSDPSIAPRAAPACPARPRRRAAPPPSPRRSLSSDASHSRQSVSGLPAAAAISAANRRQSAAIPRSLPAPPAPAWPFFGVLSLWWSLARASESIGVHVSSHVATAGVVPGPSASVPPRGVESIGFERVVITISAAGCSAWTRLKTSIVARASLASSDRATRARNSNASIDSSSSASSASARARLLRVGASRRRISTRARRS